MSESSVRRRRDIATIALCAIALFAIIGVVSEVRMRQIMADKLADIVSDVLGETKPVDVLNEIVEWRKSQKEWRIAVSNTMVTKEDLGVWTKDRTRIESDIDDNSRRLRKIEARLAEIEGGVLKVWGKEREPTDGNE